MNLGKTLRQKASPLALMPPILGVGFVLVVAYQAATGGRLMTPVGPGEVGAVLGLGILPTALGHTFYFSSLAGLKSFETATLALIEPIGASSLAVVVFNEIPGGLFVLGAAFVLLGVVLVPKE